MHHRHMLYQLQQLLEASPQVRPQDVEDFRRLLWAAHLTCLANQSRQASLLELAARQLTALLRFVGIVPADRRARTGRGLVGGPLWLQKERDAPERVGSCQIMAPGCYKKCSRR